MQLNKKNQLKAYDLEKKTLNCLPDDMMIYMTALDN